MVNIYNLNDFEKMRKAGELAANALDYLCKLAKVGVTSNFLDEHFNKYIKERGGNPACLGFENYPKSICVSVNDVICHGIPNDIPFKDGDIVKIDIVVELEGYHGDTCRTVVLGNITKKQQLLVDCTYKAMMNAINGIKGGDKFSKIGSLIEQTTSRYGFSIAREYCGHGIGKTLHEDPCVLHYANQGNLVIEPGMCFTIEPMINLGKGRSRVENDGWTVRTLDGSTSCQFEHTLGVKEDNSIEIFTLLKDS